MWKQNLLDRGAIVSRIAMKRRSVLISVSVVALKGFAPVTLFAASPLILVVHPSVTARSVKELIALAKAHPRELFFGSPGNGSPPHLAGEMFNTLAGVKLVHVPYKGTGQSMQDLLGGQHLVAFDTMPASAPHVRSGKLRAVAVSTKTAMDPSNWAKTAIPPKLPRPTFRRTIPP